jgi:putative transcriptional regulator
VTQSLRGRLLVASPKLLDPNFLRAVVLLVEHGEDGALGLVLNRPSATTVGETGGELKGLVDAEGALWVGGPVAPASVIVLGQFEQPGEEALIAFADVGVLTVRGAEEEARPRLRRSRAFIGHAGWGPGQLETELERDDWIVVPARREDAFTEAPQQLWRRVLERKGGSYALLARMPVDPSVN